MRSVILPALVAPLVSGIREPMERGLLERAATHAAVALPSVIRPADEEPLQASPAAQLEDHELVHYRGGTTLDSDFKIQYARTGCPFIGCTSGCNTPPRRQDTPELGFGH
jgi:hypothetical protein